MDLKDASLGPFFAFEFDIALTMVRVTLLRLSHGLLHHEPYLLPFSQVHLRAKFKAWSRSCYRLGLTTSSTGDIGQVYSLVTEVTSLASFRSTCWKVVVGLTLSV